MNYRQILRKLFLYASVEKEEYNALSAAIRRENMTLLSVFSQLAGIMFFLLYITSMITQGFATVNSSTYMICGFVMLAIMLCIGSNFKGSCSIELFLAIAKSSSLLTPYNLIRESLTITQALPFSSENPSR